MASTAHLSSKQITTVAADLRIKMGRNVVEAGFDAALVEHNIMYSEYFKAEQRIFGTVIGISQRSHSFGAAM